MEALRDGLVVVAGFEQSVPRDGYDPNFDASVRYFENVGRVVARLDADASSAPGPHAIGGDVTFMLCNDVMCLPPTRRSFLAEPTPLAREIAGAAAPATAPRVAPEPLEPLEPLALSKSREAGTAGGGDVMAAAPVRDRAGASARPTGSVSVEYCSLSLRLLRGERGAARGGRPKAPDRPLPRGVRSGSNPCISSITYGCSSHRHFFVMKRPAFAFPLFALALLGLAACGARTVPEEEAQNSITDPAFLQADFWNDGQAEVAFYEVQRSQNQYGQEADQSFLVGTYVVKHDFDPEAMTKATDGEGVPAFKYALFYEFESGSYQYKRNFVINVAQADLHPLKQSFTSFDWCANRYEELAFHPGGEVAMLKRTDDYGNAAATFDYRADAYPVTALPMLMRGLDFSAQQEHAFFVLLLDGTYVGARARLDGTETLEMSAGPAEAERIVVTYGAPVPSLVGEESDLQESYWRGTGTDRLLLKLESETGRYRMTLVEQLRTPYWNENLWPRLQRVAQRP